MTNNPLANAFSAQEQQLILTRLYNLLGGQATRYLAGDGSSLPVETAEELLRSLLYTLRQTGRPEREWLTCNLEQLLRQGQQLLQKKLLETKRLWETACQTAPPLRNVYLEDTLRGIVAFFQYYDLWYFAHQIPCAIDYPLCVPVSEELQGVSYLEQWLRRLLLENWFLGKFPPRAVSCLLARCTPDYADCPLNLCEQPLLNAVALTLLQKEPAPLLLLDADLAVLTTLLHHSDRLEETLRQGLAQLLAQLEAPERAAAYFELLLADALPRLRQALAAGALRGFFAA